MLYRLRPHTGNHQETGPDGHPVLYKAGDVVESHFDLQAAFPGKFDVVEEPKSPIQKAAEEGAKGLNPNDTPEDTQKPTKKASKGKAKAKPKKKAATPGRAKDPIQKAAEKGAKDITPEDEGEDEGNPLGRNVTKRFPKALEQDFLVYSDGGAFSVVEADEAEVALNDKPLKRKDVDPFIQKYLES